MLQRSQLYPASSMLPSLESLIKSFIKTLFPGAWRGCGAWAVLAAGGMCHRRASFLVCGETAASAKGGRGEPIQKENRECMNQTGHFSAG